MDHKWLEDFLMLARERNFSKASALRHVTQPQFSRRIRALELWAGSELINRSGIPITLTPAGDTLLPAAKISANALADARERIARLQGGGNWATLFTGRTLSRTVVPLLLAKIRKQLGDVPVLFVSLKPSPSRSRLFPKMNEVNAQIKAFLQNNKKAVFADVYSKMLDANGAPMQNIFLDDKLHMNAKGYAIWKEVIGPLLLK